MARSWIVLTAARAPHAVNVIIAYTEWDGYVAAADEVVYTDPVDVDGNAVDALWKVGGTVTFAAGVYVYVSSGMEPTLAERQRGFIYDAYLHWRIFGRTGHWAGIRSHTMTITNALYGTDKWAYHIVALVDQAIQGAFPITGAYSAANLQAFIEHAENILRRLGPAWYAEQFTVDENVPKTTNDSYRMTSIDSGTTIYTDIVTILGELRTIDGMYEGMGVAIRDGFNAEDRNLGH